MITYSAYWSYFEMRLPCAALPAGASAVWIAVDQSYIGCSKVLVRIVVPIYFQGYTRAKLIPARTNLSHNQY